MHSCCGLHIRYLRDQHLQPARREIQLPSPGTDITSEERTAHRSIRLVTLNWLSEDVTERNNRLGQATYY